MPRILIIILIVLAGLLILPLIGFAYFTQTDPGRDQLRTIAETQATNALGMRLEIGELGPGLPGRLTVRDVVMADGDGVFLTLDEAEIVWSPFALIGQRVAVQSVRINGVDLARAPVTDPAPEPDNDAPVRGFEFPESLPNVVVEAFSARDITLGPALLGEETTLSADGKLRIGGRDIALVLKGETDKAADRISIDLNRDPSTDRLAIDLSIRSEAEGLIARLSPLDSLQVALKGAGPVDAFAMEIDAAAPPFADATGALTADFYSMAINLDANAELGTALADLAETLGPTIALKAGLGAADHGLQVDLEEIATAVFSANGIIAWENEDDALASASAKLAVTLTDDAPAEALDYVGRAIDLDASLDRANDGYAGTIDIVAPRLTARMENIRTDLKGQLASSLSLDINASDRLPAPLDQGGTVRLDLDVTPETLGANNLSARLAAGLDLGGNARIAQGDQAIAADLRFTIAERVIKPFVPDLSLGGPVSGTMALNGAPGSRRIDLAANAPRIALDEFVRAAGPLIINAREEAGGYAASARYTPGDNDGALQARATFRPDEVLSIGQLTYTGTGYELQARGDVFLDGNIRDLMLTYSGDGEARPLPGPPLTGLLEARGSLSRDGTSALTAEAVRLSFGDLIIRGLTLSLDGPADRLTAIARLDRLAQGGTDQLKNLDLRASLDMRDGLSAEIATLSGITQTVRFRNTQPFSLALGDGVAIDNVRLDWGNEGTIGLDGAFSNERWQSRLTVENFSTPDATVFANASIDLDTDRDRIATGELSVSSIFGEEDAAPIAFLINWDGREAVIRDAGDNDDLSADIRLPVMLQRAPALSIAMGETVNGNLVYDGEAQNIAAFLPASLQTLEGALKLRLDVSGAIAAPNADIALTMTDGAYTEISSGLSIVDIDADFNAALAGASGEARFNLSAAGANDDRKTITGDGLVSFGDTMAIDAGIAFDRARFAAGPVTSLTTTGDIRVTGGTEKMRAAGTINIDEMNIEAVAPAAGANVTPIEIVTTEDLESNDSEPTAPPAPPIDLDIKIRAPNEIFVRGFGLESEWSATIDVTGNATEPLLLGKVDVIRGTIDFTGRRFEIATGEITFDRLGRNIPILDIRAEYDTNEDLIAALEITGRADDPMIGLDSTPTLPREDIMALMLFGKPASELKAQESAEMALALAQLSGIGPFGGGGGGGLTGSARQALGLDLLNLDAGDGALTVGKYIAEGLFVTATQNAKGDQGAVRVEYEVTDQITLETQLQQDGDQTVSANWKKDF